MKKIAYMLAMIGILMILIGVMISIKSIEAESKFKTIENIIYGIYVDKTTCNEYFITKDGHGITPRYANGDSNYIMQNVEDQAREQVDLLLAQDAFKDCKIRIMPDVHAGAGFTGNLGNKVIPNIVGVDIGCVNLGKDDIDLAAFDNRVRERVPSRFNTHEAAVAALYDLRCYKYLRNVDRILASIGTLGGGNHFIEIDKDDDNNKYLIIHTGSRNLGKQVAEIYQELADKTCNSTKDKEREIIDKLKSEHREKEIQSELIKLKQENSKIPKELAYLEGKDRVLIPMNMRDGCIIGVGKGNEDWNYSAPHGAGRVMSREELDMNEYAASMKGIYTTSVNEGTIDEAPMVYKPMQEIVDNKIEKVIKPIYNFKAS